MFAEHLPLHVFNLFKGLLVAILIGILGIFFWKKKRQMQHHQLELDQDVEPAGTRQIITIISQSKFLNIST